MMKVSKANSLIVRVVVGVVLTVALLGLARILSANRPRDMAIERGGLRIDHRTVVEQIGPGGAAISVSVTPSEGVEPVLLCRDRGEAEAQRIRMAWIGDGRWEASLPARDRGERLRYAISVMRGETEVARIPEEASSFLLVKYKGQVSNAVLIPHIIFMFAAFYFMVQSLWSAVEIVRGTGEKSDAVKNARWVVICSFIGGWPLGFLLNHQAFGVIWEGYPFGYDVTDNKTQVMFVFWLVSLLLVRGSFLGRGEEHDRLGARNFAVAVMVSFVVSLLLFIVPHSI